MSIRFYPEPEGNCDKDGKEYQTLGPGQLNLALINFIAIMKESCHKKSWGLAIHSANDGKHSENPVSMHYKGLAIDFDCYKLDPATGRNTRVWDTFEEQKQLLEEIAASFPYDLWAWPDDEQTHSHVSVHP
jgi:hypothetical protein